MNGRDASFVFESESRHTISLVAFDESGNVGRNTGAIIVEDSRVSAPAAFPLPATAIAVAVLAIGAVAVLAWRHRRRS